MNQIKDIYTIILIVFVACFALSLNSCSSSMKCEIYGKNGTKIYNADGIYLGRIDGSGKANIKLPRDHRYDLLYAEETDDAPRIPIGLNYDKRGNQEALMGMLATIGAVPTLGISAYAASKYFSYLDVKDQLKLNKRQSSNSDLSQMIYSSSRPVDEIKALPEKQHKHGNKSNKKLTEIPWINKDGCINTIVSVNAESNLDNEPRNLKIGDNLKIAFLFFNADNHNNSYSTSNPIIKISGTLNDGDFNYIIALNNNFKKVDDGYLTTCKNDNSPVKIIQKNASQSALTFSTSYGICLNFLFANDSFETDNDVDYGSLTFQMLQGL